MIIKADNRGRLALSKIDTLTHNKMGVPTLPGSEWDVTYADEAFTVKPVGQEPKSEWVGKWELAPGMIGEVILITGIKSPEGHLPEIRLAQQSPVVAGVLEAYSSVQGDEWAILRGHPEKIYLTKESTAGAVYGGGKRFYVKGLD